MGRKGRPAYNAPMGRRIWILAKTTYLSFARDNCTQLAAAISYYVRYLDNLPARRLAVLTCPL